MQVFLPYPNFESSVACLDPKRLGNQVYNEGRVLIQGKWPHHPVSKMWIQYRHALAQYCLAGLKELSRRGWHYPHHYAFFEEMLQSAPDTGLPPFIGNEAFHASHRAALLFKNFEHYKQFGWVEQPAYAYVWPTTD